MGVAVPLGAQRNFSAAAVPAQKRDNKPLIAVVTGANTGVGYNTALELARNGGHVIMACRSKARAEVRALFTVQ